MLGVRGGALLPSFSCHACPTADACCLSNETAFTSGEKSACFHHRHTACDWLCVALGERDVYDLGCDVIFHKHCGCDEVNSHFQGC